VVEAGEAVTGRALMGVDEEGRNVVVIQYCASLELLRDMEEDDVGVVLLASADLPAEIKAFVVEQTRIDELISVKVYCMHNGLALDVLENLRN